MEMKATDSFAYEIGYFKFNEGAGKVGFNGLNTSLLDLMSPQGGTGTVLGFGSNDKVTITNPTNNTTTTINSLLGFISFLKKNANANILSTPQILALDNQEALIEVGDKVATSFTQTPGVNGAATVVTPQLEDANISLKIKPFISPTSNSIRLEIKSSVKQLSQITTVEAFKTQVQPLATRKIETNIVVRNGDTAVLGGLMKDEQTEDVFKVPLLGDIPIIGWLFKSRKTGVSKTNMTIFLTPKIIRSSQDANKLLSKKLDDRLDHIKATGGKDPFGTTADKLRAQQTAPAEGNVETNQR
jgi:general secretion pathway protein D